MLFVWIFLVLGAFFLIALVDFVLRNPMFAETFVIKIGVPFTKIEYIQEDVEFIYIIAGSLLLGALMIAISTWVLDAKRKFKVRGLRKELKNLQKAVEEAKASLPEPEEDAAESAGIEKTEEQMESSDASLSPEEITKSFEDAVEGGDFLENPSEEARAEEEHEPEEGKDSDKVEDKRLPQNTAIEAEVVSPDDQASGGESLSPEEDSAKKKESDQA